MCEDYFVLHEHNKHKILIWWYIFAVSMMQIKYLITVLDRKISLPLWTNTSRPWSMWAWVKLSTAFMGALFRARCPLLGGVTMKCSSSGGVSRSCTLRSSKVISVTDDTQTWTHNRQGQSRCHVTSGKLQGFNWARDVQAHSVFNERLIFVTQS